MDDLNGPGVGNFPRVTGDCSVDFAFFVTARYSRSKNVLERLRFTRGASRTALRFGKTYVKELLGLLDSYVSNI